MPAVDEALRNICSAVGQPLMLIQADQSVLFANQAFGDALGRRADELRLGSLFELPDGEWNGPRLRQILVEAKQAEGNGRSLDLDWKLGALGGRRVQLSVSRLSERPASLLLLLIRETPDVVRRLERHADMARLLYRATSLASSSDSLDRTLEFCIYAVCSLTGWPIGHAYVVPESEEAPLVSTPVWRAPPGWDLSALRRDTEDRAIHRGMGLPGVVWESQGICWKEKLDDPPPSLRTDSLKALDIQAAVAFPVQLGERTRAVLEFFNTGPTPRSADIVMFCNHMSDAIGRVIERQEVTARLREARDAAQRADRAKSVLLTNVSHELLTPMTSILGMLALSLEEKISAAARDYLKTAQTSAKSLMALLSNLLEFAGLESGEVSVASHPFKLREVLAEAVEAHSRLAKEKGLRWQFSVDENVPDQLNGDTLRLVQIVDHLVGNAVKFTHQGHVRLDVRRESDTLDEVALAFVVSDTGPGITPADRARIPEAFAQADSSLTRPHGGAGLGLAICRAIVDRMGGQLSLEDQSESGCRVRISLPFRKTRPQAQTAASGGTIARPTEDDASRPGVPEKTMPQPLHILLAEDTPAIQKVVRTLLSRRGHRVTLAANGREALDQIAEHDFDVVLMDVQMPVMDGYEATTVIRELERTMNVHTPIIALTAHSAEGDREKCLRAGMDACLVKPIDFTELIKLVEEVPGAGLKPLRGDARQPAGGTSPGLSHDGKRRSHLTNPRRPANDMPRGVIDLREARRRLGGDEDLLCEFVKVFYEDSPKLMDALRTAVSKQDAAGAARAAHSLRGLAANFNAATVVDLASTLERCAQAGHLDNADELLEQLSEAVALLKTYLEAVHKP